MRRIARSAIVECSARQMYDLVEDIEAYPEFLPWCSGAHVRERTADRTVATIDVVARNGTFVRTLPRREGRFRLRWGSVLSREASIAGR